MRIGFVGLGRMGRPIAAHLAAGGHDVTVFDIRPDATAASKLRSAATVATAAANAEVVFTSLPGPSEVEATVLGADGLLATMAPGSVYIDLSTNSPALVRDLASRLRERGITMLDAPVSGGVDGAEAGTLSIMAGGDREAFERLQPLLSLFATKLFYCGEVGAGSVVKLCNNICGAAYGVILGEALTLGVKAGVDLETLAVVIGASTGSSVRLTNRFPRYLFRRQFQPGFSAVLSAKDTRLALELAQQLGVPMQMASLVAQELAEVLRRGRGDADFDLTVTLQEERAGVRLELPTV